MSVRLDHGEDILNEVHEINVTPFIDVMLVLLIIFMVAAPLATVDILVNLPASSAEPQPRETPRLRLRSAQAALPPPRSSPHRRGHSSLRARAAVPRKFQWFWQATRSR